MIEQFVPPNGLIEQRGCPVQRIDPVTWLRENSPQQHGRNMHPGFLGGRDCSDRVMMSAALCPCAAE